MKETRGEEEMATIAVLASSPLFRAGLASLLHAMGFDPVEQATDVQDLRRRLAGGITPEILIINSSHEAEVEIPTTDVKAWSLISKVVFLASRFNVSALAGYFAAGASGYLLDNISADAFEESIRLVRTGEKVFPSELASVIPGFSAKPNVPTTIALGKIKLSDREIEILRCLTNGQSNKAIANTLNIAESTVKVHVKRILQKTHATNRTQAALWGAARGVTPEFILHASREHA